MAGLLVSGVALLAGCSSRMFTGGNCNKTQAYADAGNLSPLRIPVGLDAPDTRAALRIPELNEPEAPRAAGSPCLEEPPAFVTPAPPTR
jgi:uncharacterized lipoprotein